MLSSCFMPAIVMHAGYIYSTNYDFHALRLHRNTAACEIDLAILAVGFEL